MLHMLRGGFLMALFSVLSEDIVHMLSFPLRVILTFLGLSSSVLRLVLHPSWPGSSMPCGSKLKG